MTMRFKASRSVVGMVGAVLALVLAVPSSVFSQAQPVAPTPLPVPKPAPAAPGAPTPAPPAAQATPPAPPQPGVATPGRAGRDPFDPLVTKPVEPAASPGEPEKRQPLSGLRLVGVVWDARDRQQIRALVETPDGLGYYVRVNEEKFGGRVVAIERDLVRFSVREQIPGGAARERTVELKLGSK
jgi:hypothetical protein